MSYFLVTICVRDGENEYFRLVPIKAGTAITAEKRGLKPDQEWTKDDWRVVSCEGVQNIPKQDYDVLIRYL